MTNEMRLIDANAADVESIPCYYGDRCTTEDVQEWLNEQPTVDAVEVVHARWYKARHHPYRCSNCGEMALLDMYGESHYRSNYCPNCGAKMDGV